MPRVNLMPWREAERIQTRKEFYLLLGAAVATGLLVTAGGRFSYNSAITMQESRNTEITEGIGKLNKQIDEIKDLDAQKRGLLGRMSVIERLQRSRPEVVHLFDELVKITPEGVYLTYLQQTGAQLEIRGVAQSSTRVSAFMRNIDESAWLMSPSLRVVENKMAANVRGAEFTLFAKQRPQQGEEELAEGSPKKKKRVSAEPKAEATS